MVLPLVLLLVASSAWWVDLGSAQHRELRAGDLIFHRSRSAQSQVIAEVTGSALTHAGLVLPHDGELAVLEAVGPVKWTALSEFVERGEAGQYAVRRFRDALSAADVDALVRESERLLGRPYDGRFEWGPRRIYCSELVFMVFESALEVELVVPQRFGERVPTPATHRAWVCRVVVGRLCHRLDAGRDRLGAWPCGVRGHPGRGRRLPHADPRGVGARSVLARAPGLTS